MNDWTVAKIVQELKSKEYRRQDAWEWLVDDPAFKALKGMTALESQHECLLSVCKELLELASSQGCDCKLCIARARTIIAAIDKVKEGDDVR